MHSWQDQCGICAGTKFWPSKSGYFVCFTCNPNPLQALTVLARRGSVGAIRRAEGWAEGRVDEEIIYETRQIGFEEVAIEERLEGSKAEDAAIIGQSLRAR